MDIRAALLTLSAFFVIAAVAYTGVVMAESVPNWRIPVEHVSGTLDLPC